jgi:acyl carrier protein
MPVTWTEMEERVKNIIADQLGIGREEVSLKASFTDDLGADSLDTVELVMAFEEEFQTEIPDEEAERMTRVEDVMNYFLKIMPDVSREEIESKVIAFRIREDGKIEVGLQKTDGSWLYADGTSLLPCGVYLTVFSKWTDVLKELEEMINSPSLVERDLQKFFEKYPELLKGDDYDLLIPQACIITEEERDWHADFVLHPFDQTNFCKVLELKIPQISTVRPPKHGHAQFYKELNSAINQLRDYGEAFHSTVTRERFKQIYKINVYKPDLELIAGRKWDMAYMKTMLETQRRNNIRIDDWDTHLEKLRRKFT